MRARAVALLLVAGIFAAPSRAVAAAVEIVVALQPGSTIWNLEITTLTPVGALALVVSDTLESFIPASGPELCVPEGCGWMPMFNGFNLLMLDFMPGGLPLGGQVLLGSFTSHVTSAAQVQVLPADDVVGGTVFDMGGSAIPDFTIQVVPEPGAGVLLALAALASYLWRNAINPAKYVA